MNKRLGVVALVTFAFSTGLALGLLVDKSPYLKNLFTLEQEQPTILTPEDVAPEQAPSSPTPEQAPSSPTPEQAPSSPTPEPFARKASEDELKKMGYSKCLDVGVALVNCSSAKLLPSEAGAKTIDTVWNSYSGYVSTQDYIGVFRLPSFFGIDIYDGEQFRPLAGSILEIFERPDGSSKVIDRFVTDSSGKVTDDSFRISRFSTGYKQYELPFHATKKDFILISYESNKETKQGWISTRQITWASGLTSIISRIAGINPPSKVMYETPGGKSIPMKFHSGLTHSINVTKSKILAGKIWIQIDHAGAGGCADGTEETPKEWIGKWLPYAETDFEFDAPEGC